MLALVIADLHDLVDARIPKQKVSNRPSKRGDVAPKAQPDRLIAGVDVTSPEAHSFWFGEGD